MSSTIHYLHFFFQGVGVVWPLLLSLTLSMGALGCFVAKKEGWALGDGVYWAFVTALTIGYGDFVPKQALTKFLSILVGLQGMIFTGILVAIGVQAAINVFQ